MIGPLPRQMAAEVGGEVLTARRVNKGFRQHRPVSRFLPLRFLGRLFSLGERRCRCLARR